MRSTRHVAPKLVPDIVVNYTFASLEHQLPFSGRIFGDSIRYTFIETGKTGGKRADLGMDMDATISACQTPLVKLKVPGANPHVNFFNERLWGLGLCLKLRSSGLDNLTLGERFQLPIAFMWGLSSTLSQHNTRNATPILSNFWVFVFLAVEVLFYRWLESGLNNTQFEESAFPYCLNKTRPRSFSDQQYANEYCTSSRKNTTLLYSQLSTAVFVILTLLGHKFSWK